MLRGHPVLSRKFTWRSPMTSLVRVVRRHRHHLSGAVPAAAQSVEESGQLAAVLHKIAYQDRRFTISTPVTPGNAGCRLLVRGERDVSRADCPLRDFFIEFTENMRQKKVDLRDYPVDRVS